MKHKAVTQRILAWMLALALLFTGILPANTASLTVNAASTTKSSNEITTAEEFPTQIPAGETYTLTADIKLADGQQITDLAGTLDGQGHVITLSGKALAENVSGTIQNLGVAGSVDVTSGYRGSIADNLTGTIQNSYSQAKINDNWNTVGGLAGTIKGGTVRNCYYAAGLKMMNGGIAAYAASDARSQILNSYFQSGTMIETVAMAASNADVSDCASKSADELKTADAEIAEAITKEMERQNSHIELIASENFVSDQVMQAMGSCLTNKYAEGYPGKRYYGGCEVVDQSEQIAIDRLKEIFGAEWANVQPHSGAQANAAVFLAVLNPGDKFMGLNLAHGGHLSHGSLVNTSGIIYTPCEYNLNKETGRVDYDQMEEVALREKPKMIIGGGSAYSREWDYKRMREIADKVGAILMIDMAHPAGLIAAGILENPVKYAHIVTSTTHKTLRGPRGGVIMMGKDFPNPWGKKTPKGEIKMMSQLLDSAVFPGIQGGPLEHVIAAKAVAFGEILQPEFKEYAKQVQKNAAVLAQALIDRGFTIVSGGTDNHSMLVDLRSKYPDLTGKVAEKALVSADITVNKNMVPFDSRSAFQTSGIRLGTPAITTRGAKEDLMLEIAEMIETVLSNVENEEVIAQVRARVNETMKKYPLFAY